MEIIKHRKHPSNTRRQSLSAGIKHIAWARAARWIGWGFGEALIPIFIFKFSGTFAEAGLMRSVYEIVMLLSLPIIGNLADRLSARYLILVSLALYPFVGLSYFFAGVFGMAVFIVVARAINGFLWSLENMGVTTYYRRMANHRNLATSFGYIDTWSHLGWIGAAFAGMSFVSWVPLHWLLFLIAPTSLIALVIARRAPADISGQADKKERVSFGILRSYAKEWGEWKTWNSHLWLLGALVIFSGVIEALIWFFIPIDAYVAGTDLSLVILLAAVGSIPTLSGYALGKFADKRNEYGLVASGLVGIVAVMIALAFFPGYSVKLIASFILGVMLELFGVIQQSLVTKLGPSETYGVRGSAFESIATIGDLAAPLFLGILLDSLGFSKVAFVIGFFALVLSFVYLYIKNHSRHGRTV